MSNLRSIKSSKPAPLIFQDSANSPLLSHSGITQSDFALAGSIGLQLSEPLASMQAALEAIEQTQHLSRENMLVLVESVKLARKLAMQSQQIARLASGSLRQSHETMKLDELVSVALREYSDVFRQRGIEVFQRIRAVEVIVDASLLHSLVDAALDWAAGLGRKLTVTLEMMNWPEHGLLIFKSQPCFGPFTCQF